MIRRRRRLSQTPEQQIGAAVADLSRTAGGRRVLLVLVVLAAVLLASHWLWDRYLRPRHPAGPAVRVATWNLRQFSVRRDRAEVSARLLVDL